MSPSGGEQSAAELIVDDLAIGAGEHIDRISTRLAANDHAKHQLVIVHLIGYFPRRKKRRVDDRTARTGPFVQSERFALGLGWRFFSCFLENDGGVLASAGVESFRRYRRLSK